MMSCHPLQNKDELPWECNKVLTNTKFTTETVTVANTVPIPASAHASAARPNENRVRKFKWCLSIVL